MAVGAPEAIDRRMKAPMAVFALHGALGGQAQGSRSAIGILPRFARKDCLRCSDCWERHCAMRKKAMLCFILGVIAFMLPQKSH